MFNGCHGNILLEIRRLFIKSCKESLSLQEQQVCDMWIRLMCHILHSLSPLLPLASSLSPPPSLLLPLSSSLSPPSSPGITQPSRSRSQTSPRRCGIESSQGTYIMMYIAASMIYLPLSFSPLSLSSPLPSLSLFLFSHFLFPLFLSLSLLPSLPF